MFAGTSVTVDGWRGIGRSWLPERAGGEAADHRPDRHAQHRRRHHARKPGHHRHHRIGAGRFVQRLVGAAECRRHLGEQVAVGLEGLGGPPRTGHRAHVAGFAADPHHVGHVHAGDAGEVLVGEALLGTDVRLGAPAGGAHQGELPGGVPVERTLAGERLGEVTEQRQPGERVVRLVGVVSGRLGRRLAVSHEVDATSSGARNSTEHPSAMPASSAQRSSGQSRPRGRGTQ